MQQKLSTVKVPPLNSSAVMKAFQRSTVPLLAGCSLSTELLAFQ